LIVLSQPEIGEFESSGAKTPAWRYLVDVPRILRCYVAYCD
jgi:hypothetical protein